MTPADTADLLQVGRRTLDQWRLRGGGPPYIRLAHNCVRYRYSELMDWLEGRTFRHTASESV